VLSKVTLGVAAGANITSPYANLPQGAVLVNSTLPDGSSSVKNLLFGGGAARSSLSSRTLQLSHQLSWFSGDNSHTFKLTWGATLDAFRSEASQGLLGAFTYNSLDALAAGRPSSFTRTFAETRQS
jgi:hypothetical protein